MEPGRELEHSQVIVAERVPIWETKAKVTFSFCAFWILDKGELRQLESGKIDK